MSTEVSCNLSLAFSQSNCVSFSAEYGAVLAVLKDNFCKCGKTSSLPYGIFFNLLKLFATLRAHCTLSGMFMLNFQVILSIYHSYHK